MDLETRTINNVITPYCVCVYDGVKVRTFYLTDFKNSDEMLLESVKSIMQRKYNKYKVYLHNFSYFDGIFLLRVLTMLSNNIKPTIKDNNLININFKFGEKYSLYFRDSLLLLPSSLKKLARTFNVEDKGMFPYNFVNIKNLPLDFVGTIPDIKYFDDISYKEYYEYSSQYSHNIWSLKDETIKYCSQDCKTLYQIIEKFSRNIFLISNVNVTDYPTLSSLAFAIFRTKFMKLENIPVLTGEIYNFIKKGYTGGAVDVYKPYGENVYRYDVNSLYPYIMFTNKLPIGTPNYFEGDITKAIEGFLENKNIISFLEVEIIAPGNLNEPILLKRYKNENGTSSVAPLGKWSGVYTNVELLKAIELGYQVKILRGIYFEADYIFKDYVEFFYDLKKNSEKTSPMYTISKLLLNTLYGRFGMSPYLDKHKIINEGEELREVIKKNITSIDNLGNGKLLITYNKDNREDLTDEVNFTHLNVSICISAAITAYARVFMSQFKNNPDFTLYYSDTDSIDINKPLPPRFVGSELGQMKLEHIFNEIVYLAPKVYGGITNKGEIVKIKGLKNPVEFYQLKNLLFKDSKLEVSQSKWYRDLKKGSILIKEEVYSLMLTSNKRQLIFENNKFIDTKPKIIT